MKILKIMLITSVLCLLSISYFGCASEPEAESEDQIVTVERGDLTVDITASGNLELSCTEELPFDLFYQEGTVEEVLVEAGDPVKEGQLLARLDTSEWQEELKTLEDKVTTAQRQLEKEQRDLVDAQINLITKEKALEDAEAIYVWPAEIFAQQEKIWDTERDLEDAQAVLRGEKIINYTENATEMRELYDPETGEYYYESSEYEFAPQPKTASDIRLWTEKVASFEEKLRKEQVKLDEMIAEYAAGDTVETVEITKARLNLELTQAKLEDAEKAIADAQEDLEDAQEELDEARSQSPDIIAPFDGFIIRVKVEGGEEVRKGAVAVEIADPNKFEADIMVSEMDILQVTLEGEATVAVDAMQGVSLPAKVTHISPTATIKSGVVNYEVKVELASLTPIQTPTQQEQQQEQQKAMQQNFSQILERAVTAGRISQEEAEMVNRRVEQMSPEDAAQYKVHYAQWLRTGQEPEQKLEEEPRKKAAGKKGQKTGPKPEQMPEEMPEQEPRQKPGGMMQMPKVVQLRDGLTVTVSILVDERHDVLLVPNRAIIRQGRRSYVQVISPEGAIEQRWVTTGISNWQYTEVTDGLSEGEEVVVPKTTAPVTTEPTQKDKKGPGGIPGVRMKL